MARTLTIGQDRIKQSLATYDPTRLDPVFDSMTNESGDRGMNRAIHGRSQGKVKIVLEHCPLEFLEHMLETATLTEKQRMDLLVWVGGGMGVNWDEVLTSPSDVHNFVLRLGPRSMNAEVLVNGRWYPVTLKTDLHNIGENRGKICVVTWTARIGEGKMESQSAWFPSDFERDDAPVGMTAHDLFGEKEIHELDPESLSDYADSVVKANEISQQTGLMLVAQGRVLQMGRQRSIFGSAYVTTWTEIVVEEGAGRVVVDRDLEAYVDEKRGNSYWWQSQAREDADSLPFVRCFNLTMKRWIYVDVRDLSQYAFDDQAIERLVLPEEMRSVMMQLFEAETATLAGDVIEGKHGGMIILANGPTGTGKTLTAEVCAEYTHRPLYVMEMAELGVDVNQAEERLERIFARVTRWNAVLLMDECDIFLQARRHDLTHNVMVGIFLRLMDYYHGLMFLTSNRGDVIDDAFASRITLRFNYSQLSREARERVWQILLDVAGVTITDGLDGIPDAELNGRQIRNLVRLVRVLHGNTATNEQVLRVIGFSCPIST